MQRRRWRAVAILVALLVAWVAIEMLGLNAPETRSASGDTIVVRDGDTLRIGRRDFRLQGIDAPEYHQRCKDAAGRDWPCGREARAALAAALRGRTVTCAIHATDDYGRAVATCTDGRNRDLARLQVEAGFAISDDGWLPGPYAAEARDAEAKRRGIWQGSFALPADWRAAHPYKRESFAVDSRNNSD